MKSVSLERLWLYLERLDELRWSHEDIGLRRARADGLITDLLREVADVLSEDERILVLAAVGKHDRLWSASSSSSLKRERPVALVEAYRRKQAESSDSVAWGAYGRIAQALEVKGSLAGGVRCVRKLLADLERDLKQTAGPIGTNETSDWLREGMLKQKAIYEAFLSSALVHESVD